MVENDKLQIYSKSLIGELNPFVATGTSYKAKLGETDDLISATLLALRMMTVLRDWDPEFTILSHKLRVKSPLILPVHISNRRLLG